MLILALFKNIFMNLRHALLVSFFTLLTIVALAQKPSLDHTVYDKWESIGNLTIDPYGKFTSYQINVQEGDSRLIVKSLQNDWSLTIDRGYQAQFSEDGHFLIAKIKPFYADTRKAKIDKKKAEEMPKDSLVIVDMQTQQIQKKPNVKSYQLPEKSSGILAYLLDKKGDLNKDGSDLILYSLKDTSKQIFHGISQYAINPTGKNVLLYQVKSKLSNAAVAIGSLKDSIAVKISTNLFSATNLVWDEKGSQAAFLIEPDSTSKYLQKKYTLAYFDANKDSANSVVTSTDKAFPTKYIIGGDRKIKFSKSGDRILFGIQPILPIKDTSLPEFERVSVDIWNYQEAQLQPIQLKNLETDLKNTETVVYTPTTSAVVYLGKVDEHDLKITKEGDGTFAIYTIDSANQAAFQWQGFTYKDIYALNVTTGEKQLVKSNWKGRLLSSAYDGNSLVFYDDATRKYFSYDLLNKKLQAIAKDIKFPLYDEENDMPDDPNAYGMVKWMENNRDLLIYDKYDIWLVDTKGINASIKLTNGRNNNTTYRFVENKYEHPVITTSDVLLLKGYNEINKSESLSILNIATQKVSLLNQFPMHLSDIVGAKNTKEFIVLQEDEFTAPIPFKYTAEAVAQDPKAFQNINPQQAKYNWMSAELFKWKAYTGKTTEGILYKPENFDPKKKYPMIVYFYERNNETLHNYKAPAPTPSRLNISYFASRGYLVFVPDIWYKTGYPGQGAYDYIVSGTRALIQKGFVDSTKIGLQGQSWGGYQIAYLITKTKLYAAAWAGAPVVNMTSAYGGIRWESGVNRQFQYEKTQSRIGATLWERPDLYLKNSALFSLPNVTTPLVIMSNDADGAVPWYQGIEMFTAMKRLNKKVWMLNYNNEFHNLVERRNRKDIQIREQQFFDHYLKKEPMPKWMSVGVPAIMKGRTWGFEIE